MANNPNTTNADINDQEMDAIVGMALNYIQLVDAATITIGQGGQGRLHGFNATQLRALITRWDNAHKPQ